MARQIADYIALALIGDLRREDDFFGEGGAKDFSGDLEQLKAYVQDRCGFEISDKTLGTAIRNLADCGLIRVTDDPYSGTFVKVKASQFKEFVQKAHAEIAEVRQDGDRDLLSIYTRPSDFPHAIAFLTHPLFEDYHELGREWLIKALDGLRAKADSGELNLDLDAAEGADRVSVPAADRVVTLNDNQHDTLNAVSTDLIDTVTRENAVDGDASLRDLVLGQLKAGRELIRARVLNTYVLYSTLVSVLGTLIEKYKGQALGHTARKLLDLLIEHIFGK
jgi:hypothetical protein